MSRNKKKSGIEKVPQILNKPIFIDRLFWLGLVCIIFWGTLIYWLAA